MGRSAGRPSAIGTAFDSVLVAAQAGAGWAFEALYRTTAPGVAGYLRVQGAADPDDLTGDVFLNVFKRIATFAGGEQQFRSWVFSIAHNRLVDERRRSARRPLRTDDDPALLAATPQGGDVEDDAMRRMGTEHVRRLCDALAPDQRDVLLLRMVAGMSIEDVAAALGKTQGAVKALQHRAVGALRRHIEREGVSL